MKKRYFEWDIKNRKATAIPLKGLYQLPFRFLAKGKEAKPDAKINK